MFKKQLHEHTFAELSSLWETAGFNKDQDEKMILMYTEHPLLESLFQSSDDNDSLDESLNDDVDMNEVRIMKRNRRISKLHPITKEEDGNIRLKGVSNAGVWARFPLNVQFKSIEKALESCTYASIKDLALPDEDNILYCHTEGRFNASNYLINIDERMKIQRKQYILFDLIDLYMSILVRNHLSDNFKYIVLPSNNLRHCCDKASKYIQKETLSEEEKIMFIQTRSNIVDFVDHIKYPNLIKFLLVLPILHW